MNPHMAPVQTLNGCTLFLSTCRTRGTVYIMRGPTGTHTLAVSVTPFERLCAHWSGFCGAEASSFSAALKKALRALWMRLLDNASYKAEQLADQTGGTYTPAEKKELYAALRDVSNAERALAGLFEMDAYGFITVKMTPAQAYHAGVVVESYDVRNSEEVEIFGSGVRGPLLALWNLWAAANEVSEEIIEFQVENCFYDPEDWTPAREAFAERNMRGAVEAMVAKLHAATH